MSSNKRRAGGAASPEMSVPEHAKKRKRNDDTYFVDEETTETTTETGLKLMRLLKKSTDKTGRIVAVHFLDLPSKDEYPQYYQQVKMPISLNMVEDRLQKGKYATMEKLEADLKRLVQNAKEFNSTKSEVYEDAERIRKALSNFMPKHNPAYLDTNYRAYPTPIPSELLEREGDAHSTPGATGDRPASVGGKRRKSMAASTDGGDSLNDDMSAAQIEMLNELMEQPDAVNFYEKPPKRDYPEYYRLIKRPSSITDVKKLVERGKIENWESFAGEVRLIWDNAKQFNEDGSEIYEMAVSLDDWFEAELNRKGVMPKKPKITIKQPKPPSTLVKFTRSTPNPAGGLIDNESLRRQREETGQALSRANRGGPGAAVTNGSTPTPVLPVALERSSSTTGSVDRPGTVSGANSTKNEQLGVKAEAGINVPADMNHISKSLPTPVAPGTPVPVTSFAPMANGYQYHAPPPIQSTIRRELAESDNPIERKFRDPGKGIEDALLASVTYMTHPKLPNDPKWKLSRYASGTRTQTSSYIFLPSDHYYLRIFPSLTKECLSRKKHKVCVTRNWEIISPAQDGSGAYDFRLHPGMNEVVVDVIAELAEGDSKSYAPPQLQVDFERIKFFIVLREATPE